MKLILPEDATGFDVLSHHIYGGFTLGVVQSEKNTAAKLVGSLIWISVVICEAEWPMNWKGPQNAKQTVGPRFQFYCPGVPQEKLIF